MSKTIPDIAMPEGKPPADRILVEIEAAAEQLGIGRSHLSKHLDSIPHMRIGTRLLFSPDALREWAKDCCRRREGSK